MTRIYRNTVSAALSPRGLARPFILICAVLLIGACTRAVKSTDSEPQQAPEPAPKQTLIGTWQTTYRDYHEELGEDGMRTITLTFTKDRWVQHNTVEFTSVTERHSDSGGWTSTDNTVTKIRYEWDDEADTLSTTPTTFVKSYVWGDAERNTLLVHIWEDDEADHFERFTRVQDAEPSLTGLWTYETTWHDHPDLGVVDQHWTFTLGEDGSFSEVYRENDIDDTNVGHIFTLLGTVRHERENNYLFVTVTSGGWETIDGADGGVLGTHWVGQTIRYAYAPTESPDHLTVSTRVAEVQFDETSMTWVDHPNNPHGEYWMHLKRQGPTP